jgi:hypothetical protein
MGGGVVETIARPDAPYDLTDEQAQEWWAVVNRLPADWFTRETQPLLAQYCRHVVQARRVAELIDRMQSDAESFDVRDYDRLLKMQDREGRAISALASSMRISQQATLTRRADKGSRGARKPWEG